MFKKSVILWAMISITLASGVASAGGKKVIKRKVVVINFTEGDVKSGPHLSPEDSNVVDAEARLAARMLASVEQPLPE